MGCNQSKDVDLLVASNDTNNTANAVKSARAKDASRFNHERPDYPHSNNNNDDGDSTDREEPQPPISESYNYAMAASHARQARQRVTQRERVPDSRTLWCCWQQQQLKKNLHLQLNTDAVKKPELPLMATSQMTGGTMANVGAAAAAVMPPRQRVQFADASAELDVNQAAVVMNDTRRRRASSVTLSMNSPEGAEFHEVAHDGPAELGKRTKRVKKLGKGAGGTVYMSIYLPELKLVAVKVVVVYKVEERHMAQHELHALHENLAPSRARAKFPRRAKLVAAF